MVVLRTRVERIRLVEMTRARVRRELTVREALDLARLEFSR